MKRIPRKKKKKIPKGLYCYTVLKFLPDRICYSIKMCPYYKHIEGIDGWCKCVKDEVDDACKSCDYKLDIKPLKIPW